MRVCEAFLPRVEYDLLVEYCLFFGPRIRWSSGNNFRLFLFDKYDIGREETSFSCDQKKHKLSYLACFCYVRAM